MTTPYLCAKSMELLLAYSRNPSVKIRNELVELNTGLVRKVAYRISRQCSEPQEDLEQIGYLGIIRAIERFNPHHGYAFSSFAIPYIRGEILHYLRDKGGMMRIPRRQQELYNKGKKLRKKLTTILGRTPQDIEMAKVLGVSLHEWNECQLAFQNRLPISLDVMVHQMMDSSVTFGDTLPDVNYQAKQNIQEEQLQIQLAITQLEDKTKDAIEWVFLREMSRKEAAKQIGISPMTVTRHLKKGLEQLSIILQPQVA